MDSTNQDNVNIVNLWEQMGASTGSYIGKLIGMYTEYGLQAYDQLVISPLKQFTSTAADKLENSQQPPDIREQTWGTMGKEYGEKLGSSIGMTMDLFVNNLKNATPPAADTSVDNQNNQ
ncbi:MAG TPA: hypothetical protein VNT57_04240 [Desulfobacteria bacterium]|nr:hypothetical protein [Desulfobacteria bacterium]